MQKTIIYTLLTIGLLSCSNPEKVDQTTESENYYQITGEAQGTTYSIIYQDDQARDLSASIDSLLANYDTYLSVYQDSSIVTKFNKTMWDPACIKMDWNYSFEDVRSEPKNVLTECFEKSKNVYFATNGAFNPAVYPLVKYWGFYDDGFDDEAVSEHAIDSLLQLVNFSDTSVWMQFEDIKDESTIVGSSYVMCKKNGRSQLDFNAIAQGHSVDVIASFMSNQGLDNYMIELGGEVVCKGVNNKNGIWRIGVDKPVENSSPGSEGFQMIVELKNKALATSGNYRKFYEKDGMKYSHTIDPISGYPVTHSLLSATVVTNECTYADAYATAFMVMGVEKTQEFVEQNEELNLEVYLVYTDDKGEWATWSTPKFDEIMDDKVN